MEWDKIADKWADMTHRLRGDRIAAALNIGTSNETRPKRTGADSNPTETLIPEGVGADLSQPSNQ